MTEQDWITETDPRYHLKFLFPKERVLTLETGMEFHRKLRLWAVACCRLIWPLLQHDRLRNAVLIAERYAEGLATNEEMQPFVPIAWECRDLSARLVEKHAAAAVARTCDVEIFAPQGVASWIDQVGLAERKKCSRLFTDIIPNPFRPVAFNSSWLTPTVRNLAQAVYDERQMPSGHFDNLRLAVLADALEDTGCDNADILCHLRSSGSHVRGCWPVDMILGDRPAMMTFCPDI